MSQRLHRGIQRELRTIADLELISEAERAQIAAAYPVTAWNLLTLVRWFTILGAVATGAGILTLLRHLGTPIRLAELGLGVGFAALLAGGLYLERRKQSPKAGAALQLMASFALQGFTVALAIDFSTGSDNWPALVGVDAVLIGALAYGLQNRLVLIHALVNAFTFFGGETGYASGWGAYWLGMTYPARFFGIGLVSLGISYLHATELKGRLQGFARVYLHFGLLLMHLSLWFFSLFGWFDDVVSWSRPTAELLLFSLLWAGVSIACIVLAGKWGLRALRAYGLTFLTINAYTFYFQFIVANSGEAWFVHMLLTGASLIAVGNWASRSVRRQRA